MPFAAATPSKAFAFVAMRACALPWGAPGPARPPRPHPCGGQGHVDWKPFQHPQLGALEIGGWDKMNYWRNPPPHPREREAARFPGWMAQLAVSARADRAGVVRTEVSPD